MTTAQKVLLAIIVYQLISARMRYRGGWWAVYVFLVGLFVGVYYAVSRVLIVWPYRLAKLVLRP